MAKRNELWKQVAKYMRDNDINVPLVEAFTGWAYKGEKVGEWPKNAGDTPKNFQYIRHPQPLNTWRLFTP